MALPLPMDLDKRSMRMALSCRSKVILYSLNAHRMTRADLQRLIDDKTKPIGSLGRLENLAVQAAAILGDMTPSNASASLTIFAADHGIAAQRVSTFPQEVTGQMVANFLAGGAAANVIAAQFDIPVTVVDCGIAHPPRRRDGLIDLSLGGGTADSSTGPAMSPETARKAIAQGRHFACGIESKIVCFGEMGIANTSAAALLAHKLSGISVAELVGRGTVPLSPTSKMFSNAQLRGLERLRRLKRWPTSAASRSARWRVQWLAPGHRINLWWSMAL